MPLKPIFLAALATLAKFLVVLSQIASFQKSPGKSKLMRKKFSFFVLKMSFNIPTSRQTRS